MGHRSGRAVLLSPRRLELLLAAAAYPGLHLRSAARLLLQTLPTVRFHVDELKSCGLLETRSYFRRTALFLPGLYPMVVEPFLVAWEDPVLRPVLKLLRNESRISIEDLAAKTRTSVASAVLQVSRLRSISAVQPDGERDQISLSRLWLAFEALCSNDRSNRASRIVDLLMKEDLHPQASDQGEGRYRFEVDGPRSRLRFTLPLDPLVRDGNDG